MSKIALNSTSGDSGTVTFTSPVTNSSRTLTIPDKTGTISVTTDFTDGLTTPSFASMNSGPLGGFRNILVNGGFDVFQRGVNETVRSINYVIDRWGKHQYQACAHSRQAFVPGGAHPGNARYVLRASADNVNTGYRLHASQGVELADTVKLRGRTVTLSGYVRFSSATTTASFGTFAAMVGYSNNSNDLNFGSSNWAADGSANSSSILQGSLPTTWQKFSVSLAIGASAQNVVCIFTSTDINTVVSSDWFELSNVQLEVGSVATPFETRPYSVELALCQRYYLRIVANNSYSFATASSRVTNSQIDSIIKFPVTMRVAPTFEQTGTAANYGVYFTNVGTPCTSVPTLQNATTDVAKISFFATSGHTAGQAGEITSAAAGAYLGFTSEL